MGLTERRRRLAPIALGALLHCTLVFRLAAELYVVPFTYSTNDDYSDAVQVLQPAVMPLPRRASTQVGCIEGVR